MDLAGPAGNVVRALLITCALYATGAGAAQAQAAPARAARAVPITIAVTLPASRPELSVGGLLVQTAAGVAGGIAGAIVTAVPFMGGTDSGDTAAWVIGGGYIAGTAVGIHYVGRRQHMRASPWATTAGVILGAAVGGATVQADEEGHAEPNVFVLVAPSMGGVAGYALTRRER